jgi:hypothetical protein
VVDEGSEIADHGAVGLPRRAITITMDAAAALIAILAVTYLVVACESLPGFLGPVAADTQPRTKLGAALLIVAVLLAASATGLARVRRRGH